MSCYVIVGLPRTGTTILNSLIHHQYGGWDLGEKWNIDESTPDLNNIQIKSNLPLLIREQRNRLSILRNSIDKNWIVKMWTDHAIFQKEILCEMMIESDIKFLMTQRKNIQEHFNSWLNAYYRTIVYKSLAYESFNLNNRNDYKYDTINISAPDLISYTNYFLSSLKEWRLTYELFKEKVILISYEDEIKKMNLSKIEITEHTVNDYNKKEEHYIPTPYNCTNVSQRKLYEESLDLLKNYQYLLEV